MRKLSSVIPSVSIALIMILSGCHGPAKNAPSEVTTDDAAQVEVKSKDQKSGEAVAEKETSEEGAEAASDSKLSGTIKFFHRWPQDPKKAYFDEKISQFEALHPDVKIESECVINDAYKEKIRVLISSANVPDLFTSWSHSFAANLVSSGKVRCIDDLYEADPDWASKIMSSQIEGFSFDHKRYGVPLTIDGKAFFYNKKIFDEHNLKAPKTYKEMLTLLDDLKKAGYETPIVAGLSDPWVVSHFLGPIFDRVVPREVRERDYNEKTGEFTDPNYVKGLEIFKELSTYMGDISSSMSHEDSRSMFISGEVPIIFLQLAEIRILEDGQVDFDFGYFNFPEVEGGLGDQNTLEGAPEGYMLSESCNEASIEFLKFLTSTEAAADFTKQSGELTAMEGSVNQDTASLDSLAAYELIKSATSITPWFDNAVNINVGDVFMRGGQSIAIGEKTAEEVMKDVQQKALSLH
ncbi:MAG: extracellular solute-binding protein [Eubacteriales bacterium]|nr:extracellular solute-binding protein [Eubacteriales bacterium]